MRHFCIPSYILALCVLSLLFVGRIAYAQPSTSSIINISSGGKIEILPHAELLTDESHALTLNDVLSERFAQEFKPFTRITNPRKAYWLRFTLENKDSVSQKRYVQVGAALIDSALLYHRVIRRNDEVVTPPIAWDSSINGNTIAFAKRPLPLKGVWHVLTIPPHSVEIVLLRITTQSGLSLDMILHDDEQFRLYRDGVITFYSLFAGMMLFAMVYNLVLAISTHDKAYNYYVFHTGVWFFGGVLGFFPLLEQQFPNVPFLTTKLQLALLVTGGLSTTLFAIQFLDIRRYAPRIYKFMVGNIIFQCAASVLIATPLYNLVSVMLNISFVPGAISLIVAAIAAWRQGYAPARLYLLGWSLYLISIISSILSLSGIFEYSEFRVIRVLWIGVATETVIFSFALVERINTIRRSLEHEQQHRILADQERERERERTLEIELHNKELECTNIIITRQAASIQQANVMLIEQNTRLEELNHEKNEILAIVSHDLKNPLSALKGLTELLQEAGRDKTIWKSALLQMMITTDRMLALVKNLLDVNRLETEGMVYNITALSTEVILTNILAQYKKVAEAKGIHILRDVANNNTTDTYNINRDNINRDNITIEVLADAQALTQILDNLLSNAIKYSPYRANVFVSAFTYNAQQAEYAEPHRHNLKRFDMLLPKCVVMVVKDQGPGISEKDQSRLFGKFTRLSAQPTGGEHSTGLGLSIVKKMVEGMNGRVWCESDFGYGATFFVALPQA